MSGRAARRRETIAALLAGTAAPTAPAAAEEQARLRRVAARQAWARETLAAWRAAHKALDAAWDRQLAPYRDWDDEELPDLPDPPEQALVDTLWQALDDACELDRWPRHLHWSL